MAKEKVKCPIHWVSVVFIFITVLIIVVSLYCVIMLFVEDKNFLKYEESYETEEDVRNSKAYSFVMATLKDINGIMPISEINKIQWMYCCVSKTNKNEGAYFKITYTANDEIKTAYYYTSSAIVKQFHPIYISITRVVIVPSVIEESFYNNAKEFWLIEENEENAYWSREKEYNNFVLSVLKNDLLR